MEYYEEEDNDTSYWDKPDPKEYRTGEVLTTGNTGSFQCPNCGSYNTTQGVFFDECRSCDWGQGY